MSTGGYNDNNNTNLAVHVIDEELDTIDAYGQSNLEYQVAPNLLDDNRKLCRNLEIFEKEGFFLNPAVGRAPESMIAAQNETGSAITILLWRKAKTSSSVQTPTGGNQVLGAPYYIFNLGPGRTSDAVDLHPALQVRVVATWKAHAKNQRSASKGKSVSEIVDLPEGKGVLSLSTEGTAVVLKFDSSTHTQDDRIIMRVPANTTLSQDAFYEVYIMQKGEVVAGPYGMDSTSRCFVLQFVDEYVAAISQEHSTGKKFIGGEKVTVVGGEFLVALYEQGSKITRQLVAFSQRDYNQQE